ncbi:hypothetical protein [uncultured Treponema sp.]|uniref:hypothetical protein n=1 Tax=uncultured Treponema sp. TaxID=162155 RepID=UPI0025DC3483|nr:hypothetical protein [uncultured Treponema sp.]
MKKITKLAALLAASTLLFSGLFLSCSSDDDDDGNSATKSDKEVQKEEEKKDDEESNKVAEPKLVVNATWDFKADLAGNGNNNVFSTYPISLATKGKNSIDNSTEKGASLVIKSGNKFKWKDETSDNPNAYGLYCASKKVAESTSYTTLDFTDTANYAYGVLELTTTDSSKLSFDISSNTEGYNSWVIVTDKDGKVLLAKENLVKNQIETLTTSSLVSAGTYTIYMQASRLHKVTALNELTANASDVVTKISIKYYDEDNSSWAGFEDFDIGAESISASDLNTKIKNADAAKPIVTEIVKELNGILAAAKITDKTATADSFDFIFFGSEADWKAFNDADDADDDTAEAAALAKKLSTIEASKTVYVNLVFSKEYESWFAVVDDGDVTPIAFDVSTSTTMPTWEKGGACADGTYDGVTVANIKYANSGTKQIELTKKTGTASFNVDANAKISITVASTGANNESAYTVVGGGLNESKTIAGAALTEVTFTATEAGPVVITAGDSRAIRIQKITVTYN